MAGYLVTGVAGFIANRVAARLLDAGHTVYGVDNMNTAYDVRMKEHRIELLLGREGFTFKKIDIGDREAVAALSQEVGEPAAVFNLAARAGVRVSLEDPWVYVDTNLTGTLNLLELCREKGIDKFILASTSSAYGADSPVPAEESADTRFPLQPYAASKLAAEAMCHAYHHLYDIDVTVFRYFTVYGPAGRPDMALFRFVRWIIEGETLQLNGDGSQQRGFTYIDDIARGTVLGLRPLGYEIINLGGHEVVSINDSIAIIETLAGKKAEIEYHPFHKADMMANWASTEKAEELLGWQPGMPLQTGIERMVVWYMEHREWASQLDLE